MEKQSPKIGTVGLRGFSPAKLSGAVLAAAAVSSLLPDRTRMECEAALGRRMLGQAVAEGHRPPAILREINAAVDAGMACSEVAYCLDIDEWAIRHIRVAEMQSRARLARGRRVAAGDPRSRRRCLPARPVKGGCPGTRAAQRACP